MSHPFLRAATCAMLVALSLSSAAPGQSKAPVIGRGKGALEFNGSTHVNHGQFWPDQQFANELFWDAWVRPSRDLELGYVVSDGYGGAHALLLGLQAGGEGLSYPTGNIWTGTTYVSFSGDDPAPAEQWSHLAVGWDGHWIVTYLDGVPVGRMVFTGPRRGGGANNGAGVLYVGGSDHLNFTGRIAQLRGFEDVDPAIDPQNPIVSAFAPQVRFTNWPGVAGRSGRPSFLADYTAPAQTVPDAGGGAYGRKHDQITDTFALPVWVRDTTQPGFKGAGNVAPPGASQSAPPTPEGALVFDSFSRANRTLAFGGAPSLGRTESGTLGPLAWTVPQQPEPRAQWGVFNGRAVFLGRSAGIAYVDAKTADQDVRADRRAGLAGDGVTGLAFRVQDGTHYWFVDTVGEDAFHLHGRIGFVDGAKTTVVAEFPICDVWTQLKVVAKGDEIRVACEGAPRWSGTNATYRTATGAGLSMSSGVSGLARWDNFTVLPAQ